MTLPKVQIKHDAFGTAEVWIDDQRLHGLLQVHTHVVAGGIPQVQLFIRPGELAIDLPETGVQILRAGPGATEFAASLSPARLERDALERLGNDNATQGEAFAAAVAVQAELFDGRG